GSVRRRGCTEPDASQCQAAVRFASSSRLAWVTVKENPDWPALGVPMISCRYRSSIEAGGMEDRGMSGHENGPETCGAVRCCRSGALSAAGAVPDDPAPGAAGPAGGSPAGSG